MTNKDMERVSKLEGAYEHMASKSELAELNGDYRVEFVRIETPLPEHRRDDACNAKTCSSRFWKG